MAEVAEPLTIAMRATVPPPPPDDVPDDEAPDTPFDFPAHRVVDAAGQPVPQTIAPRSIFDLAATVKALRKGGRFGAASGFKVSKPAAPVQAPPYAAKVGTVERAPGDGVVRNTGAQYPANRWDDQREEQEKARRARQRPPRPPKGAKRRSKKLLDLIGSDLYDD
jgi:hypothetical protein